MVLLSSQTRLLEQSRRFYRVERHVFSLTVAIGPCFARYVFLARMQLILLVVSSCHGCPYSSSEVLLKYLNMSNQVTNAPSLPTVIPATPFIDEEPVSRMLFKSATPHLLVYIAASQSQHLQLPSGPRKQQPSLGSWRARRRSS